VNLCGRVQPLSSPPSLVTVGTVVEADFGECTVEFPSGSRLRVKGAGTVGQHYLIRDGRLDGETTLPSAVVIEV